MDRLRIADTLHDVTLSDYFCIDQNSDRRFSLQSSFRVVRPVVLRCHNYADAAASGPGLDELLHIVP